MAFRPLHDRVVVKRLEGEEKTKGDDLLIMKESDVLGVVG
jgi:co-chaperonin GroES (HSP10)